MVNEHRRGSDTDSDLRESTLRSKGDESTARRKEGWLTSLLDAITARPQLPNILSYYTQLGLNFFLASILAYVIWIFVMTIRADVDKATEEVVASIITEMTTCAREYVDNKCGADMRVPAMKAVCENWEYCMNRDPNAVGRARVSASTFAHIINSFIEPISYKTMVCLVSHIPPLLQNPIC